MLTQWKSLSAVERQVLEKFFLGTPPSEPVPELIARGLLEKRAGDVAISHSGVALMLCRLKETHPIDLDAEIEQAMFAPKPTLSILEREAGLQPSAER